MRVVNYMTNALKQGSLLVFLKILNNKKSVYSTIETLMLNISKR